MKIKFSIWTVLTIIGLSLHSIVSELIRPYYSNNGDVLTFLLGVLPNFLAAALIFPFGILMIRENYLFNIQNGKKKVLNNWFWGGLVGSQGGLILWEFTQKIGDALIYDLNDIGATIIGGLWAIATYYGHRDNYLKNKTASK